jgi:hypothetical protein
MWRIESFHEKRDVKDAQWHIDLRDEGVFTAVYSLRWRLQRELRHPLLAY